MLDNIRHCASSPQSREGALILGNRGLSVTQPLEAGELLGKQLALFVAPDKDLEHRPAVDVDELQRAGPASKEWTVDKIDRGATRNAQMGAQRALPVNIEIATPLAPRRQRSLRFENAVLGMDDERHHPQSTRSPQISANRAPGADLAAASGNRSSTTRSDFIH